jgi:hypothetical protein
MDHNKYKEHLIKWTKEQLLKYEKRSRLGGYDEAGFAYQEGHVHAYTKILRKLDVNNEEIERILVLATSELIKNGDECKS